jgi:peptidoglycan hydrolase-like protein with peptidoglycan-binding domain
VISKARLSVASLHSGTRVALPSRGFARPPRPHQWTPHATKKHTSAPSHKMHGQQAIDSERVTAIQQALIREHYMTGTPSAKWDPETQAAMLKFQGDQGWQTKITPDSRALIKLGLGPDHSAAINASPNTSFNTLTSAPLPTATTSANFVAASGTAH